MKIPARLDRQFRFLIEIDQLKTVLRQNVLSDRSRRENSAEHSWHLALFAVCLAEYSPAPISIERVVKMVLLHDIVEIDAGDGFWHTAEEQAVQAEKERQAAARIFALLPADQAKDFALLWREFEAGESSDARFAKVVDRVQPVLLHEATHGVAWREHAITATQVRKKLNFIKTDAPALWPRVHSVIDRAIASGALINDEPGFREAPQS